MGQLVQCVVDGVESDEVHVGMDVGHRQLVAHHKGAAVTETIVQLGQITKHLIVELVEACLVFCEAALVERLDELGPILVAEIINRRSLGHRIQIQLWVLARLDVVELVAAEEAGDLGTFGVDDLFAVGVEEHGDGRAAAEAGGGHLVEIWHVVGFCHWVGLAALVRLGGVEICVVQPPARLHLRRVDLRQPDDVFETLQLAGDLRPMRERTYLPDEQMVALRLALVDRESVGTQHAGAVHIRDIAQLLLVRACLELLGCGLHAIGRHGSHG
mmetsp:Transcript_10408/g.25178  ORF Transcript_10408/g.25178 Transcript_10408/m.25178 type:complete len:272 (+) Transcript_10408:715-1530(+)